MKIDEKYSLPQAQLHRAETLRINPDAARPRRDMHESSTFGTPTDVARRDRDAERRLLEDSGRFEKIFQGKNYQASREKLPAESPQHAAYATPAERGNPARQEPHNLYVEKLQQSTRISDAQIVNESAQQVGQNQRLRGENLAFYGDTFRNPQLQREINRHDRQAPVSFQEDGAACYMRFLTREQAQNVRLLPYA